MVSNKHLSASSSCLDSKRLRMGLAACGETNVSLDSSFLAGISFFYIFHSKILLQRWAGEDYRFMILNKSDGKLLASFFSTRRISQEKLKSFQPGRFSFRSELRCEQRNLFSRDFKPSLTSRSSNIKSFLARAKRKEEKKTCVNNKRERRRSIKASIQGCNTKAEDEANMNGRTTCED